MNTVQTINHEGHRYYIAKSGHGVLYIKDFNLLAQLSVAYYIIKNTTNIFER